MTLRISVIGTGYLGVTHAASMAELGFEVVGVDVDQARVDALSEGRLPFHEPGLAELLARHTASGRLRFTTDYSVVGPWADIHFVGVGTPQRRDDPGADLTYVDAATDSLARAITRDTLVVGKSTVPVGTAERMQARLDAAMAGRGVRAEVAWNPEFLREGHAVDDTLHPDRLVFGVSSRHAEDLLREAYAAPLAEGTPLIVTDYPTAELVKVAANAFLATKISFINAFSEITETAGGDISVLADAVGLDPRIGRSFLNAGIGFGGGCLPKDIRALRARTAELGLPDTMEFLNQVDEINLRRRERTVVLAREAVGGSLKGKKIAVLGAAFKPESDDVRDSPALDVAVRLFVEGAEVRVFDPAANDNARKRFPRLSYVDSVEDAARGADVVLLLTEWKQFRALRPQDLDGLVAGRHLVDGRNVLDPAPWRDAGWVVDQLGRKPLQGPLG